MLPRMTILAAALLLAGCGGPSDPPTTNLVTGTVHYDGKPAEGVHVFLVPTSAPVVPEIPQNPHGITDASGTFSLTTFKKGDGAPAGGYQITMLWPKGEMGSEADGAIPDRFLGWFDVANSKLTAQIKDGTNQLPVIKVPVITRPPAESKGIPGKN